jgi:hypothetical protein
MARQNGDQVDIDLIGSQEGAGLPPLIARAAFLLLAILASLLLIPVVVLLAFSNRDNATLRQRLATAQREVTAASAIPQEMIALRVESDALQEEILHLTADLSVVSQRQAGLSASLDSIWSVSGVDIELASIRVDGRRVRATGNATTPAAIASFVERLRSTGYFDNVVTELISGLGVSLPLPTVPPVVALGTPAPAARPAPTGTAVATDPRPPLAGPVPQPTWCPPTARPQPEPTWNPYPTHAARPTRLQPEPTWNPWPPVSSSPTWAARPTFVPVPTRAHPATPYPYPTVTRQPTFVPPHSTQTMRVTATHAPATTPKASPTPRLAVRLEDTRITLGAGNVLVFSVRVHNIGTVPLQGQDNKPSGATYAEGEHAPAGLATRWRVAVDDSAHAATHAHRYRWGWSGEIRPGDSRTVTGKIMLTTAGSATYCIGIVQELSNWLEACAGPTQIVVRSVSRLPGPMPTPQSGDVSMHMAMAGISDLPLSLPLLQPGEIQVRGVGFTILMELKGGAP